MKVLVTGATGMVGRNIVEHGLSGVSLLTPTHQQLDLANALATADYMRLHQPDLVIHCAGRVGGIQANMSEPVAYLLENLDMGRNVVMAAYRGGVKKLINLGSSCMYPRHAVNPIAEESLLTGELEPTNEGYAIAKIATAKLCEFISREKPDFQYKTLTPCNLFGRFDKFDLEKAHMIPAVIRRLHEAREKGVMSVSIWGDGTARREFMYAADFADFLSYAIPRFSEMPSLLNVGTGLDYSMDEYYRAIAKVVGYTGVFNHDLSKPVGMKQKLVDVSKLQKFGWQAKTNLHEGIRKTYEFMLEQDLKRKPTNELDSARRS